jgi:hypothetical protein
MALGPGRMACLGLPVTAWLPWLWSCCGKSRYSTETYLFEHPSGASTICIIWLLRLCFRVNWRFVVHPFHWLRCAWRCSRVRLLTAAPLIPTLTFEVQRRASRLGAK